MCKHMTPQNPFVSTGMKLLRYLFGLDDEVGRKGYLIAGFSLAALKFAIDFALVYFTTGKYWTLLAYLSPILIVRNEAVGPAPEYLLWVMALYTLPFAWIGLSMSVRRAANAGLTPWLGVGFLVPLLNWLFIIGLSLAPTRAEWKRREDEEPVPLELKTALAAIVIGTALTMSMVATSVFILKDYGWSLFIGTPFVVGMTAGFLTNRTGKRSVASTLFTGMMTIAISALTTLLFAFEGIICIGMAAVPAVPLVLGGSLIGRVIALQRLRKNGGDGVKQILLVACCLPFLAGAESLDDHQPLFEVETKVEIDAPPEEVWHHVINFTELDEPPAWVKRTGIAYPIRARLEGEGVGAVRHCEFSTGAFVEPITRWEPGKRLSFDVRSQPIPMDEWSPYNHIHPPHLDGYLRSKRGEFRFVALPGGRTRLEGSTWYEIDISPRGYWSMMSDSLIHRIHERVLDHVKKEAEAAHKNKASAKK